MSCNDFIQHKNLPQDELHVPKTHTHTTSQITDLAITTPANDEVLVYNSSTSKWENMAISTVIDNYLVQTEVPIAQGLSDTTFDTAYNYQSGTLVVYLNGLRVLATEIIEDDDNTFSFATAIILAEDDVEVSYIKQ